MKKVREGQEFYLKREGNRIDRFKREEDDPDPTFKSEYFRVTHLSCSIAPKQEAYTFNAGQEWFKQRGLVAV